MELDAARRKVSLLAGVGVFVVHQGLLWCTALFVLVSRAGPLGHEGESGPVRGARELLSWLSCPTRLVLQLAGIENSFLGLLAQIANGLFWAALAAFLAPMALRAGARAPIWRSPSSP